MSVPYTLVAGGRPVKEPLALYIIRDVLRFGRLVPDVQPRKSRGCPIFYKALYYASHLRTNCGSLCAVRHGWRRFRRVDHLSTLPNVLNDSGQHLQLLAISMFQKAGYTLPRNGKRILDGRRHRKGTGRDQYTIARARYRNACKTVNITAIP